MLKRWNAVVQPTNFILCVVLLLIPSAAVSKEKKKQPEVELYALLKGTCVNDKGLSLPGVNVTVELLPAAESRSKNKKKSWTSASDVRGEFAVRLPAGPNTFLVKVSKAGFKPLEKTVTFSGDERHDALFSMEPLSTQP